MLTSNFDIKKVIPCQSYSCINIWNYLINKFEKTGYPVEIVDNLVGIKYYHSTHNRIAKSPEEDKIKEQKLSYHNKRIKAHLKQLDYYVNNKEVIKR